MTTTQSEIEAERMRRVPGIIFADGPAGRRARIAGTGIEVFEVIQQYVNANKHRQQTHEAFHWLTPEQLDAAIAYYEAFPDEIDEWLTEARELEEAHEALGPRSHLPPFPKEIQKILDRKHIIG